MSKFALLIWAYEQTGKTSTTALLGFSAILPFVFLSPVAGVLVDRMDRKKIMFFSDLGAGIITTLLLALYSIGQFRLLYLYLAEAFMELLKHFGGWHI